MIRNSHIIISNMLFWIVTNYICWLDWYPRTLDGFIQCYFLAIPFFFSALGKTWLVIRIVEWSLGWKKDNREYCKNE